MRKEITVPISQIEVWEKNLKTRATKKAGYERTKRQIERLGLYKRLLCFKENGKYQVLGGRTRFFILQEKGAKNIDITVVFPKTEAEKWEYCLSDNDNSGEWIELELLEETYPLKDEIKLENYTIALSAPVDMKKMITGVGPDPDEKYNDGDEIELASICPKCGFKW